MEHPPAVSVAGLQDVWNEGVEGEQALGFCCRATHNLWVLLDENRWLTRHLEAGTYERSYARRLDNSVCKPLIEEILQRFKGNYPRVRHRTPEKALNFGLLHGMPAKGFRRYAASGW
jgi:hypothetical protein